MRIVSKGQVAKFQLPTDTSRQRNGCIRFGYLFMPIQRLENSLGTGHGPEQNIILLSENTDWADKHIDKLGEQDDTAERYGVLQHRTPSDP